MVDYVCLECNEELEHKFECVRHNIEWNHTKFNIKGSDVNTNIKVE